MTVTLAEPQGDTREGGAESSGRQTCDRRNTNVQGGRVRAASVRANAKPNSHPDAPCRARRRAGKVHVLTRGDLRPERGGGVSRSHSSVKVCRKADVGPACVGRAKGGRNQQRSSTEHCVTGHKQPRRRQAPLRGARPLCEPQQPMRWNRVKLGGERPTRGHA